MWGRQRRRQSDTEIDLFEDGSHVTSAEIRKEVNVRLVRIEKDLRYVRAAAHRLGNEISCGELLEELLKKLVELKSHF